MTDKEHTECNFMNISFGHPVYEKVIYEIGTS